MQPLNSKFSIISGSHPETYLELLPVACAEVWEDGGVPDLGGPLLVLQERLTQVALLAQQPLDIPAFYMRIVVPIRLYT